jgi:hypothetical protein
MKKNDASSAGYWPLSALSLVQDDDMIPNYIYPPTTVL